MTASLMVAATHAIASAAPSKRPRPQQERVLPRVPDERPDVARTVQHPTPAPVDSTLPASGTASVTVAGSTATNPRPAVAGQLPIRLTALGPTGQRATATVTVHSQKAATDAGLAGVLVSVSRSSSSSMPLILDLDYRSFANAFGAGFGRRLQFAAMPSCATTSPQRAECRATTPLLSINDPAAETLRVSLAAPTAKAGQLGSSSGAQVVLAATAASSSGTGSFAATSLSPAGSWSGGGSSGSFNWTYPVAVSKSAAGDDVLPDVALSYNSGSVDGRVASTNNQPSSIGEGWDYSPGFIERTYRTCSAFSDLPTSAQTSDLCWAGQVVTLSLGGQSTALVLNADGSWHPQDDQGQRVKLVNPMGDEYWVITTTDGIQYFFGRDVLPGGTAANGTKASWNVPVYHRHDDDPCHASIRCDMTWRWNLDYVVDPHQNATGYYYRPETNYYGANGQSTPVSYTRGGALDHIDYGLNEKSGNVYATPATHRIYFTSAERCFTSCTDFRSNPSGWQDTPGDQNCTGPDTASAPTSCATRAPSFWVRTRLTSITTTYRTGSTSADTDFSPVDQYTLNQSIPGRGDPELRLDSIVRTAQAPGTAVAALTTTFDYDLFDNRLDPSAQVTMAHWRLITVTSETGQTTDIRYNQPGRFKPLCTTKPADPASNTTSCFPVRWTLPLHQDSTEDWFYKYVVTEVQVADHSATAAAPTRITQYAYKNAPAWHYDDNEVVKATERTWGQWRGYGTVEIRTGNSSAASNGTADRWTLSTSTYFRGMKNDRITDGSYTRPASVATSIPGDTVLDDLNQYSGFLRETRTFNYDGGAEISTTIQDPRTATATATASRTRPGLLALEAWTVRVKQKRQYTDLAAGGQSKAQTDYGYDSLGRLIRQTDSGATGTVAVDTVCRVTSYANNTTTWIRDRIAEQWTGPGTCPANGSPGALLADVRTYYDDSSKLGTIPDNGDGDATATWTATDRGTTATIWAKTATHYDSRGRIDTTTQYVSSDDTTGRSTSTVYALTAYGQMKSTVVTKAWGQPEAQSTTTLVNAARGNVTKATDEAGLVTEATYDSLGRLTAVWNPRQPRAGNASIKYSYAIKTSAPSTITTATLVDPGNGDATGYITNVKLLNAFGEVRQTQTQATENNLAVTDTFYDSHGWTAKTFDRWTSSGPPSGTLLTEPAPAKLDSSTTNTFDGAGRNVLIQRFESGTFTDSTTTVFSGDRVTVTPPTGGVQQTTVSDVRGQTVEIDQWITSPSISSTGVITGGTARRASYDYTPDGRQDRMITALGTAQESTWTKKYDLAGRAYESNDPDSGITTTTFDDTGAVTQATDAKPRTVAFQYDGLGRKTATFLDSLTGTKVASWTYDTLQVGKLTSSTRYYGTDAYTVATTGYDGAGNPTGTKTTVPASDAVFGGTANADGTRAFTTTMTWSATHLMTTQTPAPGGSLPSTEVVTAHYDSFGQPYWVQGIQAYVTLATYSPYGEATQYQLGVNETTSWLSYTRDPQTRRITNVNFSTQAAIPQLNDTTYTYDPAGNLTKSVDIQGSAGSPTATQCFKYDTLDQLTQAWSANDGCAANPSAGGIGNSVVGGPQPYWENWEYDAGGGRTKQVQHATSGPTSGDRTTTYTNGYTGGAANLRHALSAATVSGGTTTNYVYNADGSTKSQTDGSLTQQLTYGADGNTESIDQNGKAITYRYDADGNQLVRNDPTSRTLFLPSEEIKYDSSSQTTLGTRYYAISGTTIALRNGLQGCQFLLADPNGTQQFAAQTVASGLRPAARRYFDPYGKALAGSTGTWPSQQGFIARPFDAVTSLGDLGARKYDAVTGRFLSVDPVRDPKLPQQNNGYSYGYGNPLRFPDPTGMDPRLEGHCFSYDVKCNASAASGNTLTKPAPGGGDGPSLSPHPVGAGLDNGSYNSAPTWKKILRSELDIKVWAGLYTGARWTSQIFPYASKYLLHFLEGSGDEVTVDPSDLMMIDPKILADLSKMAKDSAEAGGEETNWQGNQTSGKYSRPDLYLAIRGYSANVHTELVRQSDGSQTAVVRVGFYKRQNFDPTDGRGTFKFINWLNSDGLARNYDLTGGQTFILPNYHPGDPLIR